MKKRTNKYKAWLNFQPRRSSKLFVCIERQERYATVSCALDPEETLLYSKVTPQQYYKIFAAQKYYKMYNNQLVIVIFMLHQLFSLVYVPSCQLLVHSVTVA